MTAFHNSHPLGPPASGPTALFIIYIFLSKVAMVLSEGSAATADNLYVQLEEYLRNFWRY